MLGSFEAVNRVDEDGQPAGGSVNACGLTIEWQNGPLGSGEDRTEPNGAFVETVLAGVKQRIEFYQEVSNGKFKCIENERAIDAIAKALEYLDARTKRRQSLGVEGLHIGEAKE